MWNPYKTDHIHSLEMVQRRAARFVTNIFHNTSTVPDMLDHLQWETLECKGCKLQLTMFYEIVNNIAEIDKDLYLILAMARKERAIKEVHADLHPRDCFKYSFFQDISPSGTNSRHLLLGPMTWYSSSKGSPTSNSKR